LKNRSLPLRYAFSAPQSLLLQQVPRTQLVWRAAVPRRDSFQSRITEFRLSLEDNLFFLEHLAQALGLDHCGDSLGLLEWIIGHAVLDSIGTGTGGPLLRPLGGLVLVHTCWGWLMDRFDGAAIVLLL